MKKRLQHRCFPVKFAQFSGTPTLWKLCEWLLRNVSEMLVGISLSIIFVFWNYDVRQFQSTMIVYQLSLYSRMMT